MTTIQSKILSVLSGAGGAYVDRRVLAKEVGASLATVLWHVELLQIRHGKTIETKRNCGFRLVEAA